MTDRFAPCPAPFNLAAHVLARAEELRDVPALEVLGFSPQVYSYARLQAAVRGDFEVYLLGWSGRVDPDGNTWTFIHSRGPQNDGRYSNPEVDRLLDEARVEADVGKRRDLYAQAFQIAIRQDRSRIYLWHRKNIVVHTTRLSGFLNVPDGLIRPTGLRLQ